MIPIIATLEWLLFLCGLLASLAALWAVRESGREKRACYALKLNGELRQGVRDHLLRDRVRLGCGLASVAAAWWLIQLPDVYDEATIIGKGMWLLFLAMMTLNLYSDHRTRVWISGRHDSHHRRHDDQKAR